MTLTNKISVHVFSLSLLFQTIIVGFEPLPGGPYVSSEKLEKWTLHEFNSNVKTQETVEILFHVANKYTIDSS